MDIQHHLECMELRLTWPVPVRRDGKLRANYQRLHDFTQLLVRQELRHYDRSATYHPDHGHTTEHAVQPTRRQHREEQAR